MHTYFNIRQRSSDEMVACAFLPLPLITPGKVASQYVYHKYLRIPRISAAMLLSLCMHCDMITHVQLSQTNVPLHTHFFSISSQRGRDVFVTWLSVYMYSCLCI